MSKLRLFAIFSLLVLILGCGPKVTNCVIDIQIKKAHCTTPDQRDDYDLPIDQMDKFSCVSPDDFAEILRGFGRNATLCTIIDSTKNDVYCSTPVGSISTTIEALNKYSCFNADDLAELIRYIKSNKK